MLLLKSTFVGKFNKWGMIFKCAQIKLTHFSNIKNYLLILKTILLLIYDLTLI